LSLFCGGSEKKIGTTINRKYKKPLREKNLSKAILSGSPRPYQSVKKNLTDKEAEKKFF